MNFQVAPTFDPQIIISPERGALGWESNGIIGRFLSQGQPVAEKVGVLRALIRDRPAEFIACITDDLLVRYKAICASISDAQTAEYNDIIRIFREKLAVLEPRLAAMVEPAVGALELEDWMIPVLQSALTNLKAFQKDQNGGNGGGLTQQQIDSAEQSLREIIDALDAGLDLAENEQMFSTRSGNRLQGAVNFLASQADAGSAAILQRMMAANCRFAPVIRAPGGAARDPNSRNIDYAFLICLVMKKLGQKKPLTAAMADAFLNLASRLKKCELPVHYADCPAAVIPANADPRRIPPHSLTPKRLGNAIRLMVPGTSIPEDVMKIGCNPYSLCAVAYVINDIAGLDGNTNAMYEYSRYLRAGLLHKQGVECPNFMKVDPFGVVIRQVAVGQPPRFVPPVHQPNQPNQPGNPRPQPQAQPRAAGAGVNGRRVPDKTFQLADTMVHGVAVANSKIVPAYGNKGNLYITETQTIPNGTRFLLYPRPHPQQDVWIMMNGNDLRYATPAEVAAWRAAGYETDV